MLFSCLVSCWAGVVLLEDKQLTRPNGTDGLIVYLLNVTSYYNPSTMIAFPNAKINIGLNIISKRDDGYHNLETIFYPVALKDALEMVEDDIVDLTVTGNAIDGDVKSNLVYKAYELFKKDFNLPSVSMHLHKVIPHGAGLGGGSADAAFMLQLLNENFQLSLSQKQLINYAAQLGADCPFFIINQPVFASETGDKFDIINLNLSDYNLLIVKPDFSISTKEAFSNITPQQPQFDLRKIHTIPIENWKDCIKNDFEKHLFKTYPQLAEIKAILYDSGALYVSMSGSGSALFGIFRLIPDKIEKLLPDSVSIYR